jgi:hypothetical protein
MQISGGASGAGYDLALYRKLQDTTQVEGQQALQLIAQATPNVASPTPPPIDAATGRLHIVA